MDATEKTFPRLQEEIDFLAYRKSDDVRLILGDLVLAVAGSAPFEADTPYRDTVERLLDGLYLARAESVLSIADRLDHMRMACLCKYFRQEVRKLTIDSRKRQALKTLRKIKDDLKKI